MTTVIRRAAVISPCGRYRYHLSRDWVPNGRRAVFVMLNPSTADAERDDPTIRKCTGFADRWGCGGYDVVNLYAYRATKPAELWRAADPIGPDNIEHILAACCPPEGVAPVHVVCAWGVHAQESHAAYVVTLLQSYGASLRALSRTRDGQPGHPLMLSYDRPLLDLRLSDRVIAQLNRALATPDDDSGGYRQ